MSRDAGASPDAFPRGSVGTSNAKVNRPAYFPPSFPALWASEWGEDKYGLLMVLSINGVRQVFRWILPGTFMMGSLESERERGGDETQHQVTITQGYWLAESACTQALWHAVTGNNPAHFKEDMNNPVEQVSWNDVQQFIEKLNAMTPGLQARLPTEAEWEYACRAGTTTPFLFGENITPKQVNYNGNFPYAGGEKGEYRGKTVPVKSFSPNPWGLYEMHGNVYEWCQDWYDKYPLGSATDPVGPPNGDARVLRGGSWRSNGRFVRSANRNRNEPDERYYYFGFRLALGQLASARQEEQAGNSERRRRGQASGTRSQSAAAARAGGREKR